MQIFTLDCDTSSDESMLKDNDCIEEIDDTDDKVFNDGMLKSTVIPTQILAHVWQMIYLDYCKCVAFYILA